MQFHCGVFQSCMSPCPHFHTLMGRVQVYISFTLLGTGVKLLNATASAHWGLVVSASLYTELSRFSVQCTRTALPTPKNAPLCKLSLLALHIFHSHVLGCLSRHSCEVHGRHRVVCSTVCMSGLHPELQQVHPLLLCVCVYSCGYCCSTAAISAKRLAYSAPLEWDPRLPVVENPTLRGHRARCAPIHTQSL